MVFIAVVEAEAPGEVITDGLAEGIPDDVLRGGGGAINDFDSENSFNSWGALPVVSGFDGFDESIIFLAAWVSAMISFISTLNIGNW